MLKLADTSIRLYRKKDGTVSVRWKSFLIIHAKQGFRLSAYLSRFDCSVTFSGGMTVKFDDISYTEECLYEMEHMVHEIWAAGTASLDIIKNTVGVLRVEYRLFSFDGQGEPSVIEQVVPIVGRGTAEQRFGARYQNAA